MTADYFSELNRQNEIEKYTIPQCVPVTKNPKNETGEQMTITQEKFLTLPEPIQDKLVSYKTSEKIQEIGKIYNLELLQLADISRAIRSYYFGEIKLQDFPQILFKEMNIDITTAQKISEIIIQKIINDKSQEIAYQKQLEKLPLSEALEKYPELGEQLITSNRLKLKSFPEPARPSIKNWLSDYTFNLGFSSHSAMDRGTYLFRNENSKVLNSIDRERLSFILKAYDENSPIDININTKQIIFPRRGTKTNKQESINNNQQSIINKQRMINSEKQARTSTPQFQKSQRNISETYPRTNNIQEVKKDSNSSKYEGFDRSKTNQIGVGAYNRPEQKDQPQDIFEKTMQFTQKDYPTQNNSASQAKNLNFSSPQRFSHEKQIQQPPTKPSRDFRNSSNSISSQNNTPPGNIVNLKK